MEGTLIQITQGTPEWEALRRTKVTATDIATLMCGTRQEVYDLYEEKVNGKKRFRSDAMARGIAMEKEAFEWYFGKRKKIERPVYVRGNILASCDAYHAPTKQLLEVKCPEVIPERVEDYSRYKRAWWQIQTQLYCSGLDKAALLLYGPLQQRLSIIEADEHAFDQLEEKANAFYEQLIAKSPPEKPNKSQQEREDARARDLARRKAAIKANLELAQATWEAFQEECIQEAAGVPFVCGDLKVDFIERPGTIDYKSIPELKKIDLEQYRKSPVQYWKVC